MTIVLIALHKPYGVLSQFTPEPGSRWSTLARFGLPGTVHPLGRLDADSEGLLLLSDEHGLNSRLLDPEYGHPREYWVQVERVPTPDALVQLERGLLLDGRRTRNCRARLLQPPPTLAQRVPPIRFRRQVPDCWLSLVLTEGRNRQVRRMTAAVGHPTLRLIRVRIGAFSLGDMPEGKWIELNAIQRAQIFSPSLPRNPGI